MEFALVAAVPAGHVAKGWEQEPAARARSGWTKTRAPGACPLSCAWSTLYGACTIRGEFEDTRWAYPMSPLVPEQPAGAPLCLALAPAPEAAGQEAAAAPLPLAPALAPTPEAAREEAAGARLPLVPVPGCSGEEASSWRRGVRPLLLRGACLGGSVREWRAAVWGRVWAPAADVAAQAVLG